METNYSVPQGRPKNTKVKSDLPKHFVLWSLFPSGKWKEKTVGLLLVIVSFSFAPIFIPLLTERIHDSKCTFTHILINAHKLVHIFLVAVVDAPASFIASWIGVYFIIYINNWVCRRNWFSLQLIFKLLGLSPYFEYCV